MLKHPGTLNLGRILGVARNDRVMYQINGESGVEYGPLLQNTATCVKHMYAAANNTIQRDTKAKTVT